MGLERENCVPHSVSLITIADLQQRNIQARTGFSRETNRRTRRRDRDCVRMSVLLPFLSPIGLRCQLLATFSPSRSRLSSVGW